MAEGAWNSPAAGGLAAVPSTTNSRFPLQLFTTPPENGASADTSNFHNWPPTSPI